MGTSNRMRMDNLRQALHAQFEQHTDHLIALTAQRTGAERNGEDPQTIAALIVSVRQALADTTEALNRMADDAYGRCERCRADIPVERLEILPHVRFCVPCQPTQ